MLAYLSHAKFFFFISFNPTKLFIANKFMHIFYRIVSTLIISKNKKIWQGFFKMKKNDPCKYNK